MAAQRLNTKEVGRGRGISRFVALCHTEGCGSTGAFLYHRLPVTYASYLMHPCVAEALVLEHGCEKITNDALRRHLVENGIAPASFGWASVQLDGGIDRVLERIETWFSDRDRARVPDTGETTGGSGLILGLLSCGEVSPRLAAGLAELGEEVRESGGSVLLPLSDGLLESEALLARCPELAGHGPTLAHGDRIRHPGIHIIDTETENWTEQITALGASGAEVMVGSVGVHPRPGHPLVPVLQVTDQPPGGALTPNDLDLLLRPEAMEVGVGLRQLLLRTVGREYIPVNDRSGLTDFQFTRGRLGVTS
jgi:altronate dehydratase